MAALEIPVAEILPEPPALHTEPLDEETVAETESVLRDMGYTSHSDRPGAEWRRPQHSKSYYEPLPVRKKKQHRHCLFTIAGPNGTPDVSPDNWFMTFLGTLPTPDAVNRRMKQCRRCQPTAHYVSVPSYEWVLMPPAQTEEEHEERLARLFQRMEEQRRAKDDQMEQRIQDVRTHKQKVRADIAQSFIEKLQLAAPAAVADAASAADAATPVADADAQQADQTTIVDHAADDDDGDDDADVVFIGSTEEEEEREPTNDIIMSASTTGDEWNERRRQAQQQHSE